jgi:hypothetical protein
VGKTYIPTQETELFGKAEEWLARVCCFAFSLSPQPFLQMMNRATADTAQQEAAATGLAPIQNYVKSIIDDVLADDFAAEDLEFVWRGDDELDPVKRQTITGENVKIGQITVNEGRVDQGREPYDNPIFDQPMFMTSNGLAPLTLTADAQGGGAQLDEDGTPVDKPSPGPDDDSDPPADVEKTLQSLIAAGDPEKLANFLKQINPRSEAHE